MLKKHFIEWPFQMITLIIPFICLSFSAATNHLPAADQTFFIISSPADRAPFDLQLQAGPCFQSRVHNNHHHLSYRRLDPQSFLPFPTASLVGAWGESVWNPTDNPLGRLQESTDLSSCKPQLALSCIFVFVFCICIYVFVFVFVYWFIPELYWFVASLQESTDLGSKSSTGPVFL